MHKAADSEDIMGEFICNGDSDLQRLWLSFINLVWDRKRVPHNWGTGVGVSIYEAGDSTDAGTTGE